MLSVFLTQNGGMLGPIVSLFGWILNGIYEFLQLLNIENVATVIILFTFITRGLMTPLNIKQQKSAKLSSKMNPEISKINAKYKGKKDEVSMRKMQLETQAVYQKYGANPASGCLPMLINLAMMYALYRVVYNIPAYINDINALYANIANAITGVEGYKDILVGFATEASIQLPKLPEAEQGIISVNHIIDILAKFKTTHWEELTGSFPAISSIIGENAQHIMRVNRFIGGLNILESPGLKFPAIIIPVLAGVLQFIQTKQITASSSAPTDDENPMAKSMKSMNMVMPIMSVFIGMSFPIGVGLYWVAGSAFAILQQFIINKQMDKVDVDTLIANNLEKQKQKKIKKGIDPNATMEDLAKRSTRGIDVNELEDKKGNSTKDFANAVKKNYEPSNYKKSDVSHKAGSIAANANLLKNKNHDKGDK